MKTPGLRPLQIAGLVLFLISPLLAINIKPLAYEGGRSRDMEARAVRNSSALATILGEIRTSMSDLMFVKTELYLHNGVAYLPHIDFDELSVSGEVKHLEEHQAEVGEEGGEHDDDDEEHVATVLPPANRDFRGFIGTLERHVKPWQDPTLPHVHSAGTELLPWYRVMTISDPNNTRGYSIGTWWLKGQADKQDEALDFIAEGIENNPDEFQLRYMKGNVELEIARAVQGGDALEEFESDPAFWYRRAMESFIEGAELVAEKRPEGHNPDEPTMEWTNYMEEDARATARNAVFLLRDHASTAEALEAARRYYAVFGHDGVLHRQIEELSAQVE